MTDWRSFSDRERKRPLICVDTLINLQSLINDNVTLNGCRVLAEQLDEIEKKKRKEPEEFTSQSVTIETTPRRVITLKEYAERRNRQLAGGADMTENISNTPQRLVIPSSIVLEEGEAVDSDEQDSIGTPEFPSLSPSLNDIQLPPIHFDHECRMRIRQIVLTHQDQLNGLRTIRKSGYGTSNPFNDSGHVYRSKPAALSRNPTTEYRPLTSADILDCCQHTHHPPLPTANENEFRYSDGSTTLPSLRDTMIRISERLVGSKSIPLVDTHCHFDLIFDRLDIKHSDLQQYFHDYENFYPPGLRFELAIQVFWRPRHITQNNWNNRYSRYLLDERVFGACGIHPHWSSSWRESSVRDIERCLRHPKMVALGEIGLDFGPKNTCDTDQQCRVFAEQLKLATKWSKPVVIHSRNAYKQTFDIMKEFLSPTHRIHLHCFVGTLDDAELFTSYFTDIKFGFTPVISRGKSLHPVIEQLDLRQILSETDSPYFIPDELAKHSRCAHPGMVYSVVEIVARIRQLPIDKVAHQLRENARQMYGV